MIDDIICRAARRRPHLADDLAQEARLSAWVASTRKDDVKYIRRAARYGIIDAVRREEHTRLIDGAPQYIALTWEPESTADVHVFPSDELALMFDLAVHGVTRAHERAGMTQYAMTKRIAAARAFLERQQ